MAKDVIYLEVDDEITAVIDKLQDSPQGVVALVLPKRATVFQSIVNMKLLKKSAAKLKKSVVLITSDDTVTGIAGAARMHVAKTLQSKPAIPTAPKKVEDETTAELEASADTAAPSAKKPETALAVAKIAEDTGDAEDSSEAIELDNTSDDSPAAVKTKPDKKLKIPDFNSFRTKFLLGGGAVVLLLIIWLIGFVVLPKATITIATDTSTVDSNLEFTANTAVQQLDKEAKLIPATAADVTKADTETVPATGTKNVGEKATGKVVLIDCRQTGPPSKTVPAGTTISANGLSFVTTAAVNVPASDYNVQGCKLSPTSSAVSVVAVEAGSKYNLSARTYSVAGFSTMTADDNDGMAGGTDSVVKVVSQADIETAQARMAGRQKSIAIEELKTKLDSLGLYAISESVDEAPPKLTANPAVGAEGTETIVTAEAKYTMLGIAKSSLEELLTEAIGSAIVQGKQEIQDNGLATATVAIVEKKSPNDQKISIKTTSVIGPNIDISNIASEAAGKKRSEIENNIKTLPGVKEVTVNYSPFWVFQTPKSAKKIQVVLEQ